MRRGWYHKTIASAEIVNEEFDNNCYSEFSI
jgi:hypothetical protein